MRVIHRATRAEIAAERQRRYLEAWPLEQQAEALQDNANGRPVKLQQMNAAFAAIRAALPYPPEE